MESQRQVQLQQREHLKAQTYQRGLELEQKFQDTRKPPVQQQYTHNPYMSHRETVHSVHQQYRTDLLKQITDKKTREQDEENRRIQEEKRQLDRLEREGREAYKHLLNNKHYQKNIMKTTLDMQVMEQKARKEEELHQKVREKAFIDEEMNMYRTHNDSLRDTLHFSPNKTSCSVPSIDVYPCSSCHKYLPTAQLSHFNYLNYI